MDCTLDGTPFILGGALEQLLQATFEFLICCVSEFIFGTVEFVYESRKNSSAQPPLNIGRVEFKMLYLTSKKEVLDFLVVGRNRLLCLCEAVFVILLN